MITRSEARQLVLKALYAAEMNDDDAVIVRNNVLRRSFWERYTFKIDNFDEPICFSEATKISHLARQIPITELSVGDVVDVTIQPDDERYVAVNVRRRNEDDEPIKAIDNETRFWGKITSLNNPFEYFEFSANLFDKCVQNKAEADVLIQTHIKNWKLDRLAKIDLLILRLAVTEWLYFEAIPVKVTINEAIELAKLFSTSNSGKFVNGVLDVALVGLQNDGKIKKIGKGLL
jgi:N utilization substance protein B